VLSGVRAMLDRFHVSVADVPVLICRGEVVLRNPTNQQIADCLGFRDARRMRPFRETADFRSLITLVNSTHIFQILAAFSLAFALVSSRYYQY
jgi:hypothetical protein